VSALCYCVLPGWVGVLSVSALGCGCGMSVGDLFICVLCFCLLVAYMVLIYSIVLVVLLVGCYMWFYINIACLLGLALITWCLKLVGVLEVGYVGVLGVLRDLFVMSGGGYWIWMLGCVLGELCELLCWGTLWWVVGVYVCCIG